MKKLSSALLAVVMILVLPMNQVMAQEITLDSAISNLQYRLTVEWDQKDLAQQKTILDAFATDVAALKKQGITDEKIFNTLSENAFDAQTAKDISNLASYAKSKKMNQSEVHKLVVDYANKTQKLGTSWSSTGTYGVVLGLVVVVALVTLLVVAASNTNGSTGTGGVYYNPCYDECYYDYWGYYYCSTYCY